MVNKHCNKPLIKGLNINIGLNMIGKLAINTKRKTKKQVFKRAYLIIIFTHTY